MVKIAGRVLACAVATLLTLALLPAGTTPAQARPKPAVCAGVSNCKAVAKRDVDGDGRTDRIGIASHRPHRNGTVTVLVRTATGKRLKITNRNVNWYGKVWFGASTIDGRRGSEIVVGQLAGAHAQYFRVITYRAGRLVLLKSPKPFRGQPGSVSRQNWYTDSSYSFNSGYHRSVSRGTVTLQAKTALRRTGPGASTKHRMYVSTYTWRPGRWAKKSFRKSVQGNKAAYRAAGWHIKGLPRY